VLLVEDHADTRRTLARLLEGRGFEVLVAGSVAAALATLAELSSSSSPGAAGAGPVDVLVSDIGLPDATGHDLMRRVRALHGPSIRGIAVSGFGLDGDVRKSVEAGFAAHVTKPIDVHQLDALIRTLLQHRPPAAASQLPAE
jgi:CheY-like chemotaxis protein